MPPIDAFYPLVSLAAFLSGGCFGFYAAWRGYERGRTRVREVAPSPRASARVQRWAERVQRWAA
jgi:hypothetical protein